LPVGIVKTALKKDRTAHLWGKIWTWDVLNTKECYTLISISFLSIDHDAKTIHASSLLLNVFLAQCCSKFKRFALQMETMFLSQKKNQMKIADM